MIRVYWKGKIQNADQVRISPVNTGLFYGESLFEAIPVYQGKAFGFAEHYARLKKGCAFLRWTAPSKADLLKGIALFHKEIGQDFMVRFNLTQETLVAPSPRQFENHPPTLYATARPLRHNIQQTAVLMGKVGVSPWVASSPRVFPNHFKAAIYMTTRAVFRDHPEWADILRLDEKGFVVDGGSSTPLWFDGKKLCFSPLELGGLASVTRIKIWKICKEYRIPMVVKAWKPADALKKGEVIMAGSGVGVLGISHINGKKLKGNGEMIQRLWDAYRVEVLDPHGR